jgi:hypothetical protein
MVLFFGGDSGGTGATLTWTYPDGTFRNLVATQLHSPTAAMGSKAMTYDPVALGVVMTGGYTASCTVTNQTWFFRDGQWHSISKETGTKIPGRWDARLVYDASLRADVTFSGNEEPIGGSNSFGSNTWELSA